MVSWIQFVGKALAYTAGTLTSVTIVLYSILSITILIVNSQITRGSDNSKSKHVLVTGGSSGIGFEVAKLYLKKGFKVTIVARTLKKLQEAQTLLLEEIKNSSDRLLILSCDVQSSEDELKKAFEPAISRFGPVDILVNSAGTSIAEEFDKLPIGEFERMLKINVLGSIYPTRVVVPAMKERRTGHIVFVSSQVAQAAIHGYTAYGASKWAIRGLAEALQMELKPFNIGVSVSYPPDTDTPGYQVEMLTKPELTKKISESGSVFTPASIAKDIASAIDSRQFNISSGLDGWLLKQVHSGMSPINNAWEVTQQILMGSLGRLIGVFVVLSWDFLVIPYVNGASKQNKKKD